MAQYGLIDSNKLAVPLKTVHAKVDSMYSTPLNLILCPYSLLIAFPLPSLPSHRHGSPRCVLSFVLRGNNLEDVSDRLFSLRPIVTLSQTYMNDTNSILEALYKFPLPESAAVNGFEVEFDGGRKVVGKVEAKKKAMKTYQQAIEFGDGAYLLEENAPDIFQLKVGNLGRGEVLTVHLKYVQELPNDTLTDNLIRFSLPMTIAPRYQPANTPARVGTNVVYSESAREYTLSLDVTCTMNGRVLGITSPTHKLANSEEGEEKTASTSLAEGYTYLDKDLVLLIRVKDSDDPRAFVEYNKETDTHCMMLTMVPRFALTEVQSELIFIVDRSGSMIGPKIEKTKQALGLFLRSLPRGCYFNVISFGSTFSPLFKDSSEVYDNSTLGKAIALSHDLDASMRGTEILSPLEWAFDHARRDMPTTVLLLTDGQVSNDDEVIDLTRQYVRGKRRSETGLRVFTLGIGNSVSHHLVDALARVGNGYSQYVGETERFEKKVVQMLKNALQPPISEYKIHWAQEENVEPVSAPIVSDKSTVKKVLNFFNANVRISQHPTEAVPTIRQTPQLIPTILPHCRFVVYCFLAPGRKPHKNLLLEGQSNDGPLKLSVVVEEVNQGSLIHTLAARKMITELQEGTSYLHIDDMGDELDDLGPTKDSVKNEIIAMGTQFSLASPHTSFIAVDKRSVGRDSWGEQHVRVEVPSANDDYSADSTSKVTKDLDSPSTSSYPGKLGRKIFGSLGRRGHLTLSIDAPLRSESGRASGPPTPKLRSSHLHEFDIESEMDLQEDFDDDDDGDVKMLGKQSSSEKEKSLATSPDLRKFTIHDLHKLIEFQLYDGCFALADGLAEFFGFENKEMFLIKTRPTDLQVLDDNAWSTLYVVAFLNKNLAKFKDEWELVANKALKWAGELIPGGLKGAKELTGEIKIIVPER